MPTRSDLDRQRERQTDRAVEEAVRKHCRAHGPFDATTDLSGSAMLGLGVACGLGCSPARIRKLMASLASWADHYERTSASRPPCGQGEDGATDRLHAAELAPGVLA